MLKVQFASQQVPGSRSGFVERLLLGLAHLFIVDFDPKHQYFFLSARVMMFKAALHLAVYVSGQSLEPSSSTKDLDKLVEGLAG
ncbi:MAG TPA: hypothetical protein VFS12_07065, partial [Terriglobia bacterium]|nr:hypothetical protein [Terriglobia bacterium]